MLENNGQKIRKNEWEVGQEEQNGGIENDKRKRRRCEAWLDVDVDHNKDEDHESI